MKFFTNIYDYVIGLAYKEKVTRYLYGLSFIESFIFPIPPDILLAPIALTKKYNWIKIAFNTTLFSVLGGLVGYIIGLYLYESSILNKIEKTLYLKLCFLGISLEWTTTPSNIDVLNPIMLLFQVY